MGNMWSAGIASRCGLVMPKIPNVGMPIATPKCIMPESFETKAAHSRSKAAVSGKLSVPDEVFGMVWPVERLAEIGIVVLAVRGRPDEHHVRQ